jgi:hypothetical protein
MKAEVCEIFKKLLHIFIKYFCFVKVFTFYDELINKYWKFNDSIHIIVMQGGF